MNERILMSSLSSKSDPYRDYRIGPQMKEIDEIDQMNQTNAKEFC